jgi:hypothetical protein
MLVQVPTSKERRWTATNILVFQLGGSYSDVTCHKKLVCSKLQQSWRIFEWYKVKKKRRRKQRSVVMRRS